MAKKDCSIPMTVQAEIETRIHAFNANKLAKKTYKYCQKIQGKFVYLMLDCGNGYLEKVCRLTYTGNLESMDFAIFKPSTETYDSNEFMFPGQEHVDGTLEGAMKAGLKVI